MKQSGELQRLGKAFLKYSEEAPLSLENIEEERRIQWGIPKAIERLWRLFGFADIFRQCCKDRAITSDFYRTIELMLADRFLCPCSKLKSYEKQEKYGNSEVELHQLYTTLTYLAEFKEQIEKELFARNVNLFNMQVNVVFYDVTTFYFESEVADELRDFGFSKDNKFGEVQVVLGLLVDMEGRPIGFDLFPGNLYEGHTLATAIDKLKQKFAIDKLIVVADRGMMSADNLQAVRNSGYQYIISARLKKLPAAMQQEVLDLHTYAQMPVVPDTQGEQPSKLLYRIYTPPDVFTPVRLALANGQSQQAVCRELRKITKLVMDAQLRKTMRAFRQQPFTENNCRLLLQAIDDYCSQRLILTWSEKRADRDKAKRDLLVAKARELLDGAVDTLPHRGARRYLRTNASEVALCEERIREDEQWDGFYGIYTNNPDLNWQVVLEHYRNLWRIEESFRILKSHFQTRPMFHWTAQRIKGHMVLCFIAFLFERTLELEMRQRKCDSSPTEIREALYSMQASLIQVSGEKFYLVGQLNALAKEILGFLRIKTPGKLVPAVQFEKEFFTVKEQSKRKQKKSL